MHAARAQHATQFFADADNGTLPAFSIVDPDFGAFSEENPQDIRKGESFAAEVINRVMHGKGWPDTLLIWVYDEHGGYYDHVPPPPAVPPDDVEGRSVLTMPVLGAAVLRPLFPGDMAKREQLDAGPRSYDRYGFRVPAVIVSPYARPDYVCTQVLDHTSVLKLVEQKWNLPPLTARDAAAASPLDALDLASPPAFLTPPAAARAQRCAGAPGRRRDRVPDRAGTGPMTTVTLDDVRVALAELRPSCGSARCGSRTRCARSCRPPTRSSTWTARA